MTDHEQWTEDDDDALDDTPHQIDELREAADEALEELADHEDER